MGRRHILEIDAECLDRVDRFQHPFDLGPTDETEQDLATSRTQGTVEIGLPGWAAHRMPIREPIVPWSFAVQRTAEPA